MATYSELENYLNANNMPVNKKGIPDKMTDGSYIGIRRLAAGFCVYQLSAVDYETLRIENKLRKAGLIKNEKSLDVFSTCLYDDPKLDSVSYNTQVKDLKNVQWFHVSNKAVSEHNFLKTLYETNRENNAAAKIDLINTNYGMDVNEQFETFSRVLDEREAFKEGKDLEELEKSAEFDADEDEEFE